MPLMGLSHAPSVEAPPLRRYHRVLFRNTGHRTLVAIFASVWLLGIPEYDEYVKSISWVNRRGLRHCGGDGTVSYFGSQTRSYPKAIWPQMMKLRPDSVPLYPGHEESFSILPIWGDSC